MSASEKVVEYNNANREVAILCNHQRSVSKAQEANLEGLGAKLEKLKDQKKVLKKILKRVSSCENGGIPTRKDPAKMAAKVAAALEKAKSMKEKAKTKDEKIAATEADEKAKVLKRELADSKFNDAHLWDSVPRQDQVIKRIQIWSEKIKKMEMNIKHKDDNKEVSLGTSKVRRCIQRLLLSLA
jgi:DNA topoisomerase-1